MGVTDDPTDPRLGRGVDDAPIGGQHDTYLVLSDADRAQGFVRPLRFSYVHVAVAGPTHPLRDLTAGELERFAGYAYVKYEDYQAPEDEPVSGRFWTAEQLAAARPCGAVTTMGRAIAETYARDPRFYGATYCMRCDMHRPVGVDGEFVWDDGSGQKVGT